MCSRIHFTAATACTALHIAPADLTGTVPESVGRMDNLTELNLEFNFLRGSLENVLCREANKMQALWMRGNDFTGPLNLTACVQLRLVDLQVSRRCCHVLGSDSSWRL